MIAITYIGHATTLIESEKARIITDPHLTNSVLGIKREQKLNFDFSRLDSLDAILISHAHHDHLDINSFKYFSSSIPVFVPVGLGAYVSKFVRNPVIELEHWTSHKLPGGVEVLALPAKHLGFRFLPIRRRTCNAYIATLPCGDDSTPLAPKTSSVFFAGDTAFGRHFAEIKEFFERTGKIDAAILPIGGWSPSCLMKYCHMNPAEALEAFMVLGAKHFIPIHYGTFRLSLDKGEASLDWLSRLALEREIADKVQILHPNETFKYDL